MAETVLSFVVEETLRRGLSLISDEVKLIWNLKDELEELQDSLTTIRAILQAAEAQQNEREHVRRWFMKLKDIAYEAEDVFDEIAYETLRRKVLNLSPSPSSTRAVVFVKKAAFKVKLAHKVSNIKGLLDKIKNDLGAVIQIQGISSYIPQVDLDRETDPVLDKLPVGREVDVLSIVNLLSRSCHQQILTIVPIVGMGGLGKTTLAKFVCQQVKARNSFDVIIWVCVSQKTFDEQKILGEMLQHLNAMMGGLTNMGAILRQLREELARKKFLLVLDDVWEDILGKWDHLKCLLLEVCRSNGNAMVVTTRSEEVAAVVETSTQHRHRLSVLSDDECWSILKDRASRNGRTLIPSNLEPIGVDIAKKCRGVPLAAKVLGWTMGFNMEEKEWLKIRDSNVLNARDEKENVESILKLSFDYLPSYLKPCFTFCSIFPKDFLIRKEELVLFWMAEGFIESFNEGNTYFNALLANSFFQDAKRDDDGDVMECKMHDLVHDLALSLSKFEISTRENCLTVDRASCIRHLYANDQFVTSSMANLKGRAKKLHTIILENAPYQKSWKLKSLRILSLNGAYMEVLPSSIGNMKHLRYLDVSNSNIIELPEFITKLYNLLTLKFLECKELTKLPRETINNLINLKLIAFSYEHQMPFRLGLLSCLETLPLFVVGRYAGGSIAELECLDKLRGQLEIRRLEDVNNVEEVERANLQGKTNIEGLVLAWSLHFAGTLGARRNIYMEVLEGLQPHSKIKRIEIRNYLGKKWASWMLRMKSPSHGDSFVVLNNLVDLSLIACSYCEQLPRLGDLPCLKFLKLEAMGRVKCIDNEFYGIDTKGNNSECLRLFPALESFLLRKMSDLTEWTAPLLDGEDGGDRVVVFPCLQELSIQNCAKLRMFPISYLQALVKLEIKDCEELSYIFDELQSFPSLTSLSIKGCSQLTRLPNVILSNSCFKELSICGCQRLRSIPEDFGKLSSLISLQMSTCEELRDFPDEILCSLTQLKKLSIGAFSEELNDFRYLNRIKDLPCLEELEIWGSDCFDCEMSILPNQLQHLTALKSLKIIGFAAMEELPEWFCNLQSLQSLSLDRCQSLKCGPTAATVRSLSNLRLLYIDCCPFLEKKKYGWKEFSHITKVKVYFRHVDF
ncbi:putative disease resistance protein RGA3 [Euphorbia lathyris]|uniref:putative disease resistance protein RGA3 n=1 Tax=Euphorbia lathyris TaxID=212925 RepID=UPI00331421DC